MDGPLPPRRADRLRLMLRTRLARAALWRGSSAKAPAEMDSRLRHLEAAQNDLLLRQDEVLRELRDARHHLVQLARVAIDDEATVRRLLYQARADSEYARAYTDPEPLVSICLPTYMNFRGLVERAIPSALGQDHSAVEVVVVGDAAPPETAEAIASLRDPRVRYENLTVRGPYPEDPPSLWCVAGSAPLNRAMQLARGRWLAVLNDDDEMRANHVSSLLAAARDSRAEVAYGRLMRHAPDGTSEAICEFPPTNHAFGWQAALQHGAMRLFECELSAWLFGEPGDWHRAWRMLRAGVRFQMIDEVVGDYYPGKLWRDP